MDDSGELSRAQFEGLLQLLDPDRERAGVRYEQLRRKLIKFFECNSCSNSEDLADETLNRVAQRLDSVNIMDVAAFSWGVARNVAQEARKRTFKTVQISELPQGEESLPGSRDAAHDIHKNLEGAKKFKCLRACMRRLDTRDRELFLAYYNAVADRPEYRQRLAETAGLTIGALRVKVNRLRDTLETCVRRCSASWSNTALESGDAEDYAGGY
jgi:DNA-directed RNA polymerase specialized sigma24 family protein